MPTPSVTFKVEDMTCPHCVATIEAALRAAMPAGAVTIDLATHRVTVAGDATLAESVMVDAGYTPQRLAA